MSPFSCAGRLFRFDPEADIAGGERGRSIIHLSQISFGSQVKLVFVLALFTALAFFALLLVSEIVEAPVSSSDGSDGVPMFAAVASIMALMIAAIQIAGLGLIRFLPWQGPSLKVEGGDHLRRVFE